MVVNGRNSGKKKTKNRKQSLVRINVGERSKEEARIRVLLGSPLADAEHQLLFLRFAHSKGGE